MRKYYQLVLGSVLISTLCACQDHQATPKVDIKPLESHTAKPLVLPLIEQKPYVIDQITLRGGTPLVLWQDQGQCLLQINQQPLEALNLIAPCRFMRSPGTKNPQVFQADKSTRIIGLVGNAKDSECGDTARAIVIKGTQVRLAPSTLSQSTFCASKGLENSQYMLFLKST